MSVNGSPRTIAFYSPASHLGGAERSLLDLASRLKGTAYAPWVILPRAEGPLAGELRERNVAYEVVEAPSSFLRLSRARAVSSAMLGSPALMSYLLRLRSRVRSRRSALVHTNGIKCHAFGALAARSLGIPVLWHLRDIIKPGPTLHALKTLEAIARPWTVANSHATAEAFGVGKRSGVVHNGIDMERFSPAPHDELKRRLGVPATAPLVGMIGVLARWKGQDRFLEAARRLYVSGSPAHFAVVGDEIYDTGRDAGYADELRTLAAAGPLEGRVHLTGFERNVPWIINGCDVVVHASKAPEPFGRVIVEAMACGKPVVATRGGGVPEIVTDEETGLLVTPDSASELADAMARLIPDAELRERIGSRGREEALRRFSLEAHVRGMLAVYDGILG